MTDTIKAVPAAILIWLATTVSAQTIEDPIAAIRAMSAPEVDAAMSAIAQQTTMAAPIQTDATTTIVRAIYLTQQKTINYTVRLSESIAPAAAAKNMASGLCSGRSVLALMERGVIYQYSVTTPAQSYNITFKRSDCPQ